jgi:hypothetical protein
MNHGRATPHPVFSPNGAKEKIVEDAKGLEISEPSSGIPEAFQARRTHPVGHAEK